MTGIAVLAGLLVAVGLVTLVAGLRRGWPAPVRRPSGSLADSWIRLTRRPPGPRGRRRDAILLISLVAGLVLALTTGWAVALIVVPMLAVGLPALLAVPRPRDVELLEGLDRWVRALAATMTTGRSVTDAIRVSRRTAPANIADEVAVLVARINNRWDTRDALLEFADALDSPDADGVIAALILASERGAVGATATLHALADSIQDQLRARRLVETERAKPYLVVRQVTVISMVVIGGVLLTSPTFFYGYRSPFGQAVLAVLVTMYLASLVLMRRRARQDPRARLLVRSAS